MKACFILFAFLVCAPAVLAAKTQDDEHPIGKVINMLKGLMAKSEMEGKAEAVAYEKFEYWCKNSMKELKDAIEEEKEQIDTLESTIDAKTKEEASLQKHIAELEQQIGELQTKGEEAEKVRKEEAATYETAQTDYQATIEAIDEALTALQEVRSTTDAEFIQARHRVNKALVLLQQSVPLNELVQLREFVSQDASANAPVPAPRPDLLAGGDRAAHVKKYESKTGSVIELLKGLKAQFEEEKLESTKAETNAQNAYDLAKQARDAAIQAATDSKDEKTNVLAGVQGDLEQAKSDLQGTQEDLKTDSASLVDTEQSCQIKATEWKERSDIRSGEIEAMKAATEILAKVGGVRSEAPGNPVPPPSPLLSEEPTAQETPVAPVESEEAAGPSFLQIADPKMKAVVFLRQKAHQMHSRALERLAQQVAAHLAGPFDEVQGMIEQMIFRLMAEQKDEDDHKNWCDQELSKTNTSKADKEDKIEELTLKIEKNQATVAQLTEEIGEATQMIADIVAYKKEATEVREIGKKENAEAIKDSQEAQDAISQAISVLETFYKESGAIPKEEYEFVQRAPVSLGESPSTWDSGYTGVADPTGQPSGIVSVLKACSEDFAEMEADTKAQEESDKKAYDQAMSDTDIEKAGREQEIEVKENEKQRLTAKIGEWTESKKQTMNELEAVNQYIKDLQPACVEGSSSYEDRKEARATEIDALRDAQAILKDAFKETAAPAPAAASFLQRHKVA